MKPDLSTGHSWIANKRENKRSRRRILGLMMTVNVVCRIHEVETRSVSVIMQKYFSLSPPECATSSFTRVVFFLRLIERLFLDVILQAVQPVASCSVQHHQVSFTTMQRTLAGNVLCGLVCSATLTPCWWRQSHLVHIGVKPAITSSNTVQAHKRVSC